MGKIAFYYDKEDDLLDISLGRAKKAISTEIKDDFFVRKDIKTKKIVGFTILNFEKSSSKKKKEGIEIPLSASFHFAGK